jgi:hypothetical protein
MKKPTSKPSKPPLRAPHERIATSLRVELAKLEKLHTHALRRGRSVNDLVVEAIDQWLERAA